MATETQLSGAQCINIVAAVQAGMSHSEVAAALALPEATVAALCAQCAQQGLMEWCIAQRTGTKEASARPVLPVDYAALPQFLIAAVSAVHLQRLDVMTAAVIFNLSPTLLNGAVLQAQDLGLAAWSAQVAATSSEPVSYSLAHFSGAHKIAMVAALLSGTKTFEQISADQCVPVRSLRAQLQRAQKLGLCAWCQEMRAHDRKRRRSAQMLAFEMAHPLPEPDFAAIPAFKHDALRALMRHELSVEQISAALTLTPETISAWAQEWAPLHPESQDTLHYSGTRRITMLAQFLSGKYGNLTRTATYLHVGRSTLERFLKEAQDQGLFAWCAALRAADWALQRTDEFDFDLSKVPVFKLAAAYAVLHQGYSMAEVAAVLGQPQENIDAWCFVAQDVGLKAWMQVRDPKQLRLVAPELVTPEPSKDDSSLSPATAPDARGRARRGDARRVTSGARAIAIVAYYLEGMKSAQQLAQELEINAARVSALARAACKQGLVAWCAAQRARDQYEGVTPELLAFEAAHPLPEPDLSTLPRFKVAAVEAVLTHTMGKKQVAATLNVKLKQVRVWCEAAQEQGLDSWRLSVLAEGRVPQRKERAYNSGRRRINILAALLSKEFGATWAVALRFHVGYQTVRALLVAARTKGLYTWCEEMRAFDCQNHHQLAAQESGDPKVDYSTVRPFKLCAVYTVLCQGKSITEVAIVLGLTPEQIITWFKEVQEQGFVKWARHFTIPERILVSRALIPMLSQS